MRETNWDSPAAENDPPAGAVVVVVVVGGTVVVVVGGGATVVVVVEATVVVVVVAGAFVVVVVVGAVVATVAAGVAGLLAACDVASAGEPNWLPMASAAPLSVSRATTMANVVVTRVLNSNLPPDLLRERNRHYPCFSLPHAVVSRHSVY